MTARSGSARLLIHRFKALVNNSVENWRPIAAETPFFPKIGVLHPKNRIWTNEIHCLCCGPALQGRFLGYDHDPFGTGLRLAARRSAAAGAAVLEGHHGSLNRTSSQCD
jgi:hypothetical protein